MINIKGIKVKYAEFITSLIISKGTIDTEFHVSSYWLEQREMRALLLHFNSKFDLSTPLVVSFSDTFTDHY